MPVSWHAHVRSTIVSASPRDLGQSLKTAAGSRSPCGRSPAFGAEAPSLVGERSRRSTCSGASLDRFRLGCGRCRSRRPDRDFSQDLVSSPEPSKAAACVRGLSGPTVLDLSKCRPQPIKPQLLSTPVSPCSQKVRMVDHRGIGVGPRRASLRL